MKRIFLTNKKLILLLLAVAVFVIILFVFFCGKNESVPAQIQFLFDSNGGIPKNWNVSAYTENYKIDTNDGILSISCTDENDVRIIKDISVKENTVYSLSAKIKTADIKNGVGATLSIDNYSIDGSCVYSLSTYGDSDWNLVQLNFKTGNEQELVRIALRVGGYSELSSGTALFKDVSLVEDNSISDYQLLQEWTSHNVTEEEKDLEIWDSEKYKSMFAVMEWAAVLSACIFYFGYYRNLDVINQKAISESCNTLLFIIILLFGVLVRFILCMFLGGHDTDMNCFIAWGQDIASNGTHSFYTAAGHEWYDYPPGYMAFLGVWTKLINLFIRNPYSVIGKFMYMVPAILADYGCMKLIMKSAQEEGIPSLGCLALGAFVFLNPALLYLSGAWGQIDSILTLFLLLSFKLLLREKRVESGIVFGAAVLMKWQALMFGPVYAAAHIFLIFTSKKEEHFSNTIQTLLSAIAAFVLIICISLPFKGSQNFLWIVDKFLSSASGYNYASVEAYNYMALCGGNWANADSNISVLPFSYKQFGSIAIIISVSLCITLLYLQIRNTKEKKVIYENVFALSAFCMTLIFTFGHYMHERYLIPVLVFLPFAYIYSCKKIYLKCSIWFTATTFLNEMCAMFVVSKDAMDIVRGTPLHNDVIQLVSLFEVAVCIYLGVFIIKSSRQKNELF